MGLKLLNLFVTKISDIGRRQLPSFLNYSSQWKVFKYTVGAYQDAQDALRMPFSNFSFFFKSWNCAVKLGTEINKMNLTTAVLSYTI